MSKIIMLANKQYINGQTDGMKLYKKKTKEHVSYVFAANAKDAKLKFNASLTINWQQVKEYLNKLY